MTISAGENATKMLKKWIAEMQKGPFVRKVWQFYLKLYTHYP